jgi:tyrosine-specific transport protein
MKSKFFPALAVLVGTTIGAGFLGIPYVVSKSGFLPGLAFLIFVAVFMLFMKMYLGEVSLRTRGNHQLTGYTERYLGKWAKFVMLFSMVFGIYSALIAYIIAEGQSFSYIFFGSSSHAIWFSIGFWIIMSCLTYIGLRALKRYEKIAMIFILFILFIVLILFSHGIKLENLGYINPENIFMPFGVILFSFLAFSAMPEVERILLGQERLMKKVIFWGIMIPLIVYIIFTVVVVGNFGANVPEIATLALPRVFSILAVLTMFTAYFSQAIAIRDMFRFDYNLGRLGGWILASILPLVLFLLIYFFKLASFVVLLSIAGVVAAGLAGILILLMNKKAKKEGNRKPEYHIGINWWIIFFLSLIFILAVVLEFLF